MDRLPRFTSRWPAVAPWLVALVAIAAYANAARNGFVLDDAGVIVRNDLVHSIDGIWRAFANPYWPNGAGQYRPLVISMFTVEWSLWGDNPLGYHVVNFVLHGVVSSLVFVLARRWLSLGGSVIAALLFAVHPVHVEAVANTVGLAEMLAACAVLAMLLLHARRSPWAIVAYGVAVFSKEHALLAPLLAGLVDLAERRTQRSDSRRAERPQRARTPSQNRTALLYGAYGGIAVIWVVTVITVFAGRPLAAVDPLWKVVDAPTRWLTMLGVVTTWTRLLFAPFELSADYSPRITLPWPDNSVLAITGAAIALGAMALCALSARRARPVAVATGWLLLTLAPVSNLIVPTGVIVAERTLYLPSVGAVLLMGLAAEWAGRRRQTVATLAAVLLASAFAVRTWTRTPVWESNRSLMLATAEEQPAASWTHVLLARVYAGNGGYADAREELRRALLLFDRNSIAWADAIETEVRAGDLRAADSLLAEARTRLPFSYLLHAADAYVAIESGRHAHAIDASRSALAAAPDSARPRILAARAWLALGWPDSARAELGRIPSGDPLRASADSILEVIGR